MEPINRNFIELFLRRTLVLSEHEAATTATGFKFDIFIKAQYYFMVQECDARAASYMFCSMDNTNYLAHIYF